jgi:predicted Holliday junction resolvase-like endonuclease
MTNLSSTFGVLDQIMGLCPCCGEPFHLSESRPYLSGKKVKSFLDGLRAEERRLELAEEKLNEIERHLREIAAQSGLRTAKKLLKKIDPIFSGSGYDPQDVKVIFHPVSYVVFHGLARDKLDEIVLLAEPPTDKATERVHTSLQSTIQSGNVEFKTIHVNHDGQVTHR